MLKYVVKDIMETLLWLPFGLVGGVALALLHQLFRSKKKPKPSRFYVFVTFMFYIYLAMLILITILSRIPGQYRDADLALLQHIGHNHRLDAYFTENIILFVPFGLLGSCLFPRLRGFFPVFFSSIFTSLAIEIVQYVTGTGLFQLDDLFTNSVGAVLGYLLFLILDRLFRKRKR